MKSTKLANIRLGFAMLTFLNSPPIFSQVELSAGAESAGLADVRVGIENVWAVYNNPADMLSDSQFRIGVFTANTFNVDALKSVSMSSIVNHRNFAFGVYYSRFGYRISRQEQLTISIGLRLNGKSSIGVTASALHATFGNTIVAKGFSTALGFNQRLTANTTLYLWTTNPIVPKEESIIQSVYIAGVGIELSKEMRWIIQSSVSPTVQPSLSTGFQYNISKALVMHFGFNTSPRTLSFGFQLNRRGWSITSANTNHQVLGFSPVISAQWSN